MNRYYSDKQLLKMQVFPKELPAFIIAYFVSGLAGLCGIWRSGTSGGMGAVPGSCGGSLGGGGTITGGSLSGISRSGFSRSGTGGGSFCGIFAIACIFNRLSAN